MSRVFKDDIGTKIRLNADVDISDATKLEIHYKKPSGTTGIWTALPEDTYYGYYITTSGDLDENGVWDLQLYVEVGPWKGHGEVDTFTVYEFLE